MIRKSLIVLDYNVIRPTVFAKNIHNMLDNFANIQQSMRRFFLNFRITFGGFSVKHHQKYNY